MRDEDGGGGGGEEAWIAKVEEEKTGIFTHENSTEKSDDYVYRVLYSGILGVTEDAEGDGMIRMIWWREDGDRESARGGY